MYESQRGGFAGRNLYVSHNSGFDTFSIDNIKQGISTSTYKRISADGADIWSFAVDEDGNMTATGNKTTEPWLYYSTDNGNTWGHIRIGDCSGYTRYVKGAKSGSNTKIFFVNPHENDTTRYGKLNYWTPQNPATWYSIDWKLPDGTTPQAYIRNLWYCNGYYYTHVGDKMYRGTTISKGQNLVAYSGSSTYSKSVFADICYCYNKYWALGSITATSTGGDSVTDFSGNHIYYSNDGLTWYHANITGIERTPVRLFEVNHKLYVLCAGNGNKYMNIGTITSNNEFVGTKLTKTELSENVYCFEVGFFATKMKGNE